MREIKLRAWDKDEKRFWHFTLNDVLERRMYYRGSWDEKVLRGEKTQYSGEKDINGKDIYHADLCLYDRNINGKKDKEVFVVEYQDGAFFIESNTERVYLHSIPEIQESIEIIGNIYETPELMEVPE